MPATLCTLFSFVFTRPCEVNFSPSLKIRKTEAQRSEAKLCLSRDSSLALCGPQAHMLSSASPTVPALCTEGLFWTTSSVPWPQREEGHSHQAYDPGHESPIWTSEGEESKRQGQSERHEDLPAVPNPGS